MSGGKGLNIFKHYYSHAQEEALGSKVSRQKKLEGIQRTARKKGGILHQPGFSRDLADRAHHDE